MDSCPLSAQSAPARGPPGDGQPGAHRPVPPGRPGGGCPAEKQRRAAPSGLGHAGGPLQQGQLRLCEGGRRQRGCHRGLCQEPVRRSEGGGRTPLRAAVRLLPGLCGEAVRGGGRPRSDGRAGAAPGTGGVRERERGCGNYRPQPFLRGGLGPGAGVLSGAGLPLAR
jgi:hypothetical protein